jgi:hypothetical protein
MGYGAMVTLHDAMGFGAMVLHGAENCNKVMAPCYHGALIYGAMQYNHGALGLGAVQKGQIINFLQIRFILCLSFRKELVSVTLTRASHEQSGSAVVGRVYAHTDRGVTLSS